MFVPFKARSFGFGRLWAWYIAHIHVSYISLTFFNMESREPKVCLVQFECDNPVDIDKFRMNTTKFFRAGFPFLTYFFFALLLTVPISSLWEASLLYYVQRIKKAHGPWATEYISSSLLRCLEVHLSHECLWRVGHLPWDYPSCGRGARSPVCIHGWWHFCGMGFPIENRSNKVHPNKHNCFPR